MVNESSECYYHSELFVSGRMLGDPKQTPIGLTQVQMRLRVLEDIRQCHHYGSQCDRIREIHCPLKSWVAKAARRATSGPSIRLMKRKQKPERVSWSCPRREITGNPRAAPRFQRIVISFFLPSFVFFPAASGTVKSLLLGATAVATALSGGSFCFLVSVLPFSFTCFYSSSSDPHFSKERASPFWIIHCRKSAGMILPQTMSGLDLGGSMTL